MANLEDLTNFDNQLRLATNDLRMLTSSRGRERAVWSDKQEVQFSQLLGAVMHLHDAVSELVARNR